MLWLSLFCINTFLLGESIEMEFVVDGTHPWQLLQSCRGTYHFPMCMVIYIWAVMD